MMQRLANAIIPAIFALAAAAAFSLASAATAAPRPSDPDLTPLYAIQGAGDSSPLARQRVTTLGIVTGVTPEGFYLQDPTGDGNPQTSDALYVYTRTTPATRPGQCVLVRNAYVQEFYAKTELSQIGAIEPSDACAASAVTPVDLPPVRLGADPQAQFERYEGMLVRLDGLDGYVHGPAKGYASGEVEIALLDAKLQPAVRGGRIFHIDAPQQAALRYLSNLLGAELPAVNWGDRVFSANEGRAPLIGVLDYNFGKYQFLPLPGANLRVERGALPGENATAASPSDFTVCTFNLHGLGCGAEQHPDPADYDAALARRARIIAGTLAGCTLIGLQETGAPADAEALARRLVEEYDLPYIAVALPGPGTFDPDFPLTNGFLLRSDRATALAVDSPQTCTAQDYDVPLTGGNSCPPGQFPLFDRPPLVLDAAVSGAWGEDFVLRVVNNHWKSKAGDESVNAPRRLEQARSIAAIVQERLDDDPAAQVIVLGDLNDFYDGPALELLTAAPLGLVNTLSYLAPSDRYTYIYNGASQALDHILISPNMVQLLSRVDAVHNSADRASGGAGQDDDAQAVSDHDPVVVQFRPEGAATIAGNAGSAGIVVGLEREGRPMQFVAASDRRGDFRIWDSTPGAVTLHYWPPAWLEVDEPSVQLQFGPGVTTLDPSRARHRSAWLAARAAAFVPSIIAAQEP